MTPSSEPRLRRLADTLADPTIAQIYDAILRDPAPSRSHLLAAGYDRTDVDRALEILHWREVIDASVPGALVVTPPDIALPAYAATLERQARTVRLQIAELAHTYHRVRTTMSDDQAAGLVRRLSSFEEITAVVTKLEEGVTTSLLATVAGGPRLEMLLAGGHEMIQVRQGTDEPIERLAVVDARAFQVDGAAKDFSERQNAGYDIRVGHKVPFNLLIVDRESAVIDTTNIDPSGVGSVLVHEPTLVMGLIELFMRLHAGGMPLPTAPAPDSEKTLDSRDQLILTLLAAGASDAVIARQARVSQRTVERRIRAAMERLDASTRFQAGVRAARAGLI